MNFPIISHEFGPFESPILLHPAAPEPLFNWNLLLLLLLTALAAAAAAAAGIQICGSRRQKTPTRVPSFYSSCSDDDNNDDTDSSASSSDLDEIEEIHEIEEEGNRSEDFSSSLLGGMGVVKAWDGSNLDKAGFDFMDVSRGEILGSFNGAVVQLASPAEIVAVADEAGGAVVRVWDARAGRGDPAGCARGVVKRRVKGVVAREGKVVVGGEGGEVAALDLRNFAVVVDEGEGFGSWWRGAARCFTLLSPRMENV